MAKNKETRHSVRRHRRIHAQKDSSDSSPKENEKSVDAKTQSEREEKTHVVKRFCNAFVIRNARWRLLGHTLRMSNKILAKKAMLYYFINFTSEKEQGFQER